MDGFIGKSHKLQGQGLAVSKWYFVLFSSLCGVVFYKSCVLRTNVLIALNKLIESKSTSGTLLPTQLVPQRPMCPGLPSGSGS